MAQAAGIPHPTAPAKSLRLGFHLSATQDHQRKAEPNPQPGIAGRVQHLGRHGGNTPEPGQVLWQKYLRDPDKFRERPGIRRTGRRAWLESPGHSLATPPTAPSTN
ncbi:hypothetical protein CCP4SC76_6750004 [Gammaproteobacteria bacterium]